MDKQDKLPTYEVEFVAVERRHGSRRTLSDRRSADTEASAEDAADRRRSRSDRRRAARRITDLIERPVAPENPRKTE